MWPWGHRQDFQAQLFRFINKPGSSITPTHQSQPTHWFPLQTAFRDHLHLPDLNFKACSFCLRLTGLKPQQAPNQGGSWAPEGRPHSGHSRALSAYAPPLERRGGSGATHIDGSCWSPPSHGQLVVAPGQVPLEALQCRDSPILSTSLHSGPAAGWRQAQARMLRPVRT